MLKRIYIEITNICNLNCEFCPDDGREKRSMTSAEFSHIISEIRPFCDHIYLHIKGEPLLHPELETLLEIADKHSMKVNIVTNGRLLPKAFEIIKSAPAVRKIDLSVHSFYEDEKGLLEEILPMAKSLSEHGKIFVFKFWNQDENSEIPKLHTEYLDLVTQYFGGIKAKNTLCDRVFLSFDKVFGWPSYDEPDFGDVGRCYGMRNMCGILSDGTVVPCCLDSAGKINLGNIFAQNFADIITSKRVTNMAEGFKNQKITEDFCRHCPYRQRFS